MSVVDLSNRITVDYETYYKLTKSSDSLVFVEGSLHLEDGPASLELTIGDKWFNCADYTYYAIPTEGFTLRPGASAVIDTEQIVGLPVNVSALVTGKGKYIFQGILVSSGKIDPGFCDHLRIGLYNGGREPAILKSGEAFCSLCFFQLESTLDAPRRRLPLTPTKYLSRLPWKKRLRLFIRRDWGPITSIIIALLSLCVAVYAAFLRKR